MPGGFPLGEDYCNAQDIGSNLTNGGTSVTGAAGAYGSWTQIISATAYDIDWLDIYVVNTTGGGIRTQCDIGIGAAASEVVIANALFNSTGSVFPPSIYRAPLSIPAGSRIAARTYNSGGTSASYVALTGYSGAFTQMDGCAGLDAIGISGTAPTAVASSGSNATKGSWVQLTASTSRDYMGLIFGGYASAVAGAFCGDIGIGGSGSEQIIVPNLQIPAVGVGGNIYGICSPYFVAIPAGTRIAARVSVGTGAAKTANLCCYGIYQ